MNKSRVDTTQIMTILRVELRDAHVGRGLEKLQVTKSEDIHFGGTSCNNYFCFEEDKD